MIYKSQDVRFGLRLDADIVNEMLDFISKSGSRETGGIMIGCYNQNRDVANVQKVTGAPVDSEHGYAWFKRGTKGLQKLLLKVWKHKEYYLGEWHYHPNASATPSFVDKSQMKEIATSNNYHCPEPILIIIGGSLHQYEVRCFVFTPPSKLLELHPLANS